MKRDLKQLYKEAQDQEVKMPKGHMEEFQQRLAAEFKPKRSYKYYYWSAAASVVILLGVLLNQPEVTQDEVAVKEQYISLGSLSPELEKIESFYTQGVRYQWTTIKANFSNKELVNATELRMNQLDKNYEVLTEELNQKGPSTELINAMIENLELRMRVLIQLKGRLNELNTTQDENTTKSL